MREKERPAKENAGDGGGNRMLNETKGKARGKEECWRGGGNRMLNEREGKTSKGEYWQGRREG